MRAFLRAGELAFVLMIGFLSFFWFSYELYFGSSQKVFVSDSWKTDNGPYPGQHAQNLFWFLQVTVVLVL